jgi:adenylate kinase
VVPDKIPKKEYAFTFSKPDFFVKSGIFTSKRDIKVIQFIYMQQEPQTYILFGMSGSGKGTQGKLLKEELEAQGRTVIYIETGARFRKFMEGGSYTAHLTKETINKGDLLPVFLPIWIWSEQLIEEYTGEEDMILDGLCRRPDEAPVLDSALKMYKRKNPKCVYFNVSDDWAYERLSARGRSDDTDEYIKSRLEWFDWQVRPAMSYFHENDDYEFVEINGEQDIDTVHLETMEKLGIQHNDSNH